MVRVYIDTEFIMAGDKGQLVSLGACTDTGANFYGISLNFNQASANQWVRDNVLKKLPPRTDKSWQSLSALLRSFRRWVDSVCEIEGSTSPEFWGYFCAYDYVILSEAMGGMEVWPKTWPQYFMDIRQYMTMYEVVREQLPPDPEGAHNALVDAIWNRKAWWALRDFEQAWLHAVVLSYAERETSAETSA